MTTQKPTEQISQQQFKGADVRKESSFPQFSTLGRRLHPFIQRGLLCSVKAQRLQDLNGKLSESRDCSKTKI